MQEWHLIVLGFQRDIYTLEEGHEALQSLRKMIVEFIDPVKKSYGERRGIPFPDVAQYVGAEQGPVNATEEEHEEIDAYIGHFLHHTRGDLNSLTMQNMKNVVRDAGEAFEVITVHFVKRNLFVFPMVDQLRLCDWKGQDPSSLEGSTQ